VSFWKRVSKSQICRTEETKNFFKTPFRPRGKRKKGRGEREGNHCQKSVVGKMVKGGKKPNARGGIVQKLETGRRKNISNRGGGSLRVLAGS